jgi:hypothetical protein
MNRKLYGFILKYLDCLLKFKIESMHLFFKTISILFLTILLTIITQVGGLIYLLSLFSYPLINRQTQHTLFRFVLKVFSFLLLYLILTFTLVPALAKLFGRVPLPITNTHHLQPLNIITCLLNRNYVRPELINIAFEVADQTASKYPNTFVNYLDANFPFINGFPLIPHLSHNDGKKLDLSFCYLDAATHKDTNACPSFIGYGICETPKSNEEDMPEVCAEKGYWRYSFLTKVVSQKNKNKFIFDSIRTKELVMLFVSQKNISKLFIEPHLKTRLNLNSVKIKFHGCRAVRHDDHIHIQVL